MNTDQLNLLPPNRRRALERIYLLRLTTLALILALALVIAAAALLVPTYVYLLSAERIRSVRLTNVTSPRSSAEETALAERLGALEADAATIASLAARPSASGVLRDVLAVGRPGVVLTGMNYTPQAAKRPGTVAISGTAASRNDLRSYQLALLSAPNFPAAELPVSSYAKDRDIPFTIIVTLATSTPP